MAPEPLEMHICRLCFGEGLSLMSIYGDRTANIPEMLSQHIGEVGQLLHGSLVHFCGRLLLWFLATLLTIFPTIYSTGD